MLTPLLQDESFLGSVAAGRECSDSALRLWWLGQSGFLLQCRDRHLLFDPYLSDSLTEKYAGTDKPHVRMTERVIAPERLDFIDVVTSSHHHTDHLDAATLGPLLHASAAVQLVIPEANRALVAERLGIALAWPIGLDEGTRTKVAGFEIEGVAAAHNEIERDEFGHCKYLGYLVRGGGWTVYHSGDTLRYDGMAERLRACRVDVAILPINGHLPSRRVAGNLDAAEAAALAHDIGARVVIPCHYEMFEFNTASPEAFAAECARLGQRCAVLRAGECWSLDVTSRAPGPPPEAAPEPPAPGVPAARAPKATRARRKAPGKPAAPG